MGRREFIESKTDPSPKWYLGLGTGTRGVYRPPPVLYLRGGGGVIVYCGKGFTSIMGV